MGATIARERPRTTADTAPSPRSPARRIILPGVLLVGLGVAALLGLLTFAADRQDRTADTVAARTVGSVIEEARRSLEAAAADYARWSVIVTDPAGGGTTLPDLLLRRLAERAGVTGLVIPDGGGSSDPVGLDDYGSDAVRMAGQAPYAPDGAVAGLVGAGRALYLMAAADVADGAAGQRRVLVLIRTLDDGALDRLGASFGITGLRFVPAELPAPARASLPLTGWGGAPLGHLAWEAARPGARMLDSVALPVVLVLAAMTALAGLVVHRAVRAAAEVDRAAADVAAANRDLAASRKRFLDFALASSDWFWETGPDHRYTYMSERLPALLGRDPGPLFGASLLDLGALVEDAGSWTEVGGDIAAGRPFRDLEVMVPGPDGGTGVFRISGQPVRDETGRFLGYRGSGVDVTAETMALMEARFMQVLVHDALDSISEGFVLFDAEGRLLLCNERYRQAYPDIADVLVPGAAFQDILRVAAERGGYEDARRDIGSWIQDRLNRHLAHDAPVDRRLSNGRWYRISEHATGSGGIVKILMDITELKLREEELAEQTGLLKATLESISQGICMVDGEGRLAAWNDEFQRLLDLPVETVRFGRPVAAVLDRLEGMAPALAEVLALRPPALQPSSARFDPAAARSWRGEPVRVGDRFLEVRRSAVPDGGFVATFADVTERHRFETVLRDLAQAVSHDAPEEFFATLALALARALDVDTAVVTEMAGSDRVRIMAVVHDGAVMEPPDPFAIAGMPCERVIGQKMCLFPSGLRSLFPQAALLDLVEAESYCGAPLNDSAGRPLGHIAVLSRRPMVNLDMAENLVHVFAVRAAAELERMTIVAALRESEGRYRQLVELAPYGIVIWDGTAIRFANSAAASILGVEDGSRLNGTSLAGCFDDGRLIEATLAPTARGRSQQTSADVVRPSGERRHVEVGAFPAVFRGAPAVLLAFNDVTERRRAEEELQRAQKMEAVGRMAGGIAHEFNNMLTAIGGFARLAERNPGDRERVLTCVREIAKASDRAAALTGQLLDFSRRRPGEEREVIALAALVRDLRVFLKPLLSAAIVLELKIRDEDAHVVASPAMLNQALLNLAINARDAMGDTGTLTITLDTVEPDTVFFERHEDLAPGRYAVIRVSDTGNGVPEELRDRIWEPFFTTKEQGKGTGLGLWMVYGTVRQVGGTVELESAPGSGATFSLFVPAVDPPGAASSGPACVALPEGDTAMVLLVDDEDSVRSFLRLALEEAGCSVVEAADGVEALERFDEHGGLFDLVVSDVAMPRMNGVELAEALHERNPELRMLFLTGYASREQAAGLTARPGRRILMKPVGPDALIDAVRTLIAE
ncbi:hybrid sensor histidine kinase/response regulator [Azospirillum halopraeferens]|uniref:hybrid sensor histidine kinase/response regulator n=1 Tax=Azospirillum halopraeferens TaxID=34010 RepID=UPI0004002E39|nr:PAS-domain containing protein [Azospirillum halopraeferens]